VFTRQYGLGTVASEALAFHDWLVAVGWVLDGANAQFASRQEVG
jgi:hypothetical protein